MQIDYKTLLIQKIYKNSLHLSVIILFHDNCPLGSNYSQTHFQINTFHFFFTFLSEFLHAYWFRAMIDKSKDQGNTGPQSIITFCTCLGQYFPSYFWYFENKGNLRVHCIRKHGTNLRWQKFKNCYQDGQKVAATTW